MSLSLRAQTIGETAAHLIRMPTVTADSATNQAALDWIVDSLKTLPLRVAIHRHHPTQILTATTSAVASPLRPKLWLLGHVDVVPAAPHQFEPQTRGQQLHGRGAFDMKGAVAMFLHALHELGPELANYDLGLMLTTDEELGGAHGIGWIVDELGARADAVIMPECGTSGIIEQGAKGTQAYRLISTGRATHGSRPWDGRNALEQLTDFFAEVKTRVPREPCGDPAHLHHTTNLGMLTGGEVANQVPDTAQALVDFRIMPKSQPNDPVPEWLAAASLKVPGVRYERIGYGDGYINNLTSAPSRLFQQIFERINQRRLTPQLSHGSSDGRFFAARDIPVIAVPPVGRGQHSTNEWVDVEDLALYCQSLITFIKQFSRV